VVHGQEAGSARLVIPAPDAHADLVLRSVQDRSGDPDLMQFERLPDRPA
jgi:hypothetical protein